MTTTMSGSATEKWLLDLFITEKKWPRYLFFSIIYVTGVIALPFYTQGSSQYWSNSLIIFLVLINTGRRMCNKYLFRGQTVQFTLYFLLALIIMTLLHGTFLYYFFDVQFRHSLLLTYLAVAPLTLFSICIGIGLKMVRYTMQQQYATATQRKNDLDMLLNQLSPHFLFNTLNNLYGLSLTHSQRMPALILQLSDLLRYTVYDARQDYVLLQSEIAYINNYIELATTNIGDRLILTTDIAPVSDPDIKIAPMLLIVFIENAFKHSQNAAADKIHINICLRISENRIYFNVRNSYDIRETDTMVENSGVGIANTVKRLELLYQDTHEYRHEKSDEFYTATLTIPIKK